MLARFYTASGDAQAQARCVVPARVLPAEVAHPHVAKTERGLPSIWQNPSRGVIDQLMLDVAAGNRIVIDCDDPYHSTNEHYDEQKAKDHLFALEQAATLIVTNDALAAAYDGYHSDIRVIPTCVDERDWQLGRQTQHLDGKMRIGYAAGWSHAPDTDIIAEALSRISDMPDVIVEFVGGFDPGWDFPYRRYPALPFPAYKAMLATWQIGLAPLVDNEINSTRSDLKALDYAISGAICVASPVGPFEHLAEKGIIVPAEGPKEWYETLRDLIESDSERTKIGLNAYQYCRIERHPANQRTAYLDALGLRRSYSHA